MRLVEAGRPLRPEHRGLARLLEPVQLPADDVGTDVERAREALLLGAQELLDHQAPLRELRVDLAHRRDHGGDDVGEEDAVEPEARP